MNIELGKVISEELADLLKVFSSSSDRADVSREHDISASTLREITYRNQSVTERSLPAVKALLQCAQVKASVTATKSKKGAKDLLAIIDTI